MAKQRAAERQACWEVRQREREARWRRHLAAWRASGTSQAEYCRQHGLAAAHFSWWKHELARRARQRANERSEISPRFVPLQLTTERAASVCEVELRNGRRMRLASGLDIRWVAELASALEAAPSC